jgi:GNAT superfamily N-acetyltransferase
MKYEVSLAAPEDVLLLPRIEREACELFRQVPVIAELPLYLTPARDFDAAQREGTLWVARLAAGGPVGFALAEWLGDEGHLEEMDVLPDHGRRGLGTALVRRVCDWAVANGGTSLTLCTFRDVPWNAPFYERLGFRRLAAAELTPALLERMDEEAAHGLPLEHRVAMRWTPRSS